jgi:Tfp pilus assembly protein PilN
MKAVNLLPKEARRGGVGPSLSRLGAAHLLIGLLVIALAVVTADVLESNTISSRKTQLANLKQETAQMHAQITRLNTYTQFEKLAKDRAATVRELASSRFDWHAALSDLSKVVPANTSLQSLVATVAPGTSISTGGGAAAGGSVRPDIDSPAFELKGCTASQDDVARLMSQLRLINDVSRVTLEDSAKQATGQSAASVSSSSSTGGCPANGPSFDMVVFFEPMTSAGTVGATAGAAPSAAATPSAGATP